MQLLRNGVRSGGEGVILYFYYWACMCTSCKGKCGETRTITLGVWIYSDVMKESVM